MQIVLPVLGVNAFRTRRVTPAPQAVEPEESPTFHLRVPKRGVDARAAQIDGEFTLLAGSRMVGAWDGVGGTEKVKRIYARHHAQFDRFVEDGSIVIEDTTGTVARDIVFPSSSAAGAVVTGRSCNGRTSWVTAEGLTFGAWETRGVDDAP